MAKFVEALIVTVVEQPAAATIALLQNDIIVAVHAALCFE